MGSYEKTFIVDGAEYELFAQSSEEGVVGYQLVAADGVPLTLLAAVPEQAEVEALVREQRNAA